MKSKDRQEIFKDERTIQIEHKLGIELEWHRAESNKASWISYVLNGVSITKEADWERMAKFHAIWSDKISSILLGYILSDEEKRLNNISIIFRILHICNI